MSVDLTHLFAPKQPWLLRATADVRAIDQRISMAAGSKTMTLRTADGSKMTTVVGVLKELGEALAFPDYYGQNSAAFYECATDLEWLPADGYVLVIANSDCLLKDEPTEVSWLTDILSQVCEAWAEPVNAGEAWDRPARPFHVILQYTLGPASHLNAAIASSSVLDLE